ncbi:MAG: PD-(D/E)XK nuclease family protein [bacterium]
MPDKFSAVWISHSSISDWKSCPRAYYLKNVYKDKRNNHKINLVTPSLSLGSTVHEVLESLSILPTAERFKTSLIDRFQTVWGRVSGIQGGFDSKDTESHYKARGEDMLRRVMAHPGILKEKAVKIKEELPQYWLSEEDNLILCGKLDWLSYNELADTIKIIDFKTGVREESEASLQLPIYYLLAHNCQSRKVEGAAYWYIGKDDMPTDKPLVDLDLAKETVLKVGKEIKLARALERFKCPSGEAGCKHCTPYEKIIKDEATFVGTDNFNRDIYTLTSSNNSLPESEVL